MINNRGRTAGRNHRESGQALVFLVLALGLVFVAAGALSVDMSNLWFHRQAAQNAADAACTAGAMDLLVDAQGLATGHQGFVNGTGFNCTTTSTASPCNAPTPSSWSPLARNPKHCPACSALTRSANSFRPPAHPGSSPSCSSPMPAACVSARLSACVQALLLRGLGRVPADGIGLKSVRRQCLRYQALSWK